ncbi:MAG: SGNH/GDSL hydrolase family protein, partial [Verrucomicrobia bacterium]|nr:SGNH/GDSL hydrolase family protein [Cytophagales bacterium]
MIPVAKILVFNLIFLIFACKSVENKDPVPVKSVDSLSYLALGDSYTIGESLPPSQRWSKQLTDLLKKEGKKIANPTIIAQTGWTTAELAQAIQTANNNKKYNMVSLLIGVNNQYREESTDKYRTEFAGLLKTAINFTGGEAKYVFVMSIPDWGVTPYAEGRDRTKIATEI